MPKLQTLTLEEVLSLKSEAYKELNFCCQTLCDKSKVKIYIRWLESRLVSKEYYQTNH